MRIDQGDLRRESMVKQIVLLNREALTPFLKFQTTVNPAISIVK